MPETMAGSESNSFDAGRAEPVDACTTPIEFSTETDMRLPSGDKSLSDLPRQGRISAVRPVTK